MIFRRVGALCITLLFVLAAMSSAAPKHLAHAPNGMTAAHCLETTIPAPAKHPCGGDECCLLCGHSQKDLAFPPAQPASAAIVYTPPSVASRMFCANQAPATKTVRAHSRAAAPRAPPGFS